MNYDIIGDIHGYADELEVLLQKLGYQLQSGIYYPPEGRKAVFLGDFIDRGPKIRETLHIVKDMCEKDYAFAIMGNHEFNAVCFHTPYEDNGGFYREHGFKEIKQHYATLEQFSKFPKEWDMFLNWFRKLPLYLNFNDFRVVHACWIDKHIKWLKNNYDGLTTDFLSRATDENTEEYPLIEDTLKGIEVKLPEGVSFIDKDGHLRTKCRLKWWQPENKRETNKDALLLCPSNIEDQPYKSNGFVYNSDKPVFFGHYWLKGDPIIENQKCICLDYSVARGGKLVAFRSEYLKSNNPEEGIVY